MPSPAKGSACLAAPGTWALALPCTHRCDIPIAEAPALARGRDSPVELAEESLPCQGCSQAGTKVDCRVGNPWGRLLPGV